MTRLREQTVAMTSALKGELDKMNAAADFTLASGKSVDMIYTSTSRWRIVCVS